MGAVKKSKIIRIPLEAYEQEKRRKLEMELRAKQLIGKPVKLSFADYFRLRTSKPIFIYDEELKRLIKVKRNWRLNLIWTS